MECIWLGCDQLDTPVGQLAGSELSLVIVAGIKEKQTRPCGKWTYKGNLIQRQDIDFSSSTATTVPFRSTWCMTFHSGWTKIRLWTWLVRNSDVNTANSLLISSVWKRPGKLPAALPIVMSVFTMSCPDCVLTSLLPYMLRCFTAQLQYLLFQDNFCIHPGKRKRLLSGLPQHSVHAPFIPAPPTTNRPHTQVGIKSVPTSYGCWESLVTW